jgi:hypothetical protein
MVCARPQARVRGLPAALVGCLVLLLVTGCVGPAGETWRDKVDETAPGPYSELTPGVEERPPAALPDGGAYGVVWDLADGRAIAGAQVVAQCVFHDFPYPLGSLVATTDQDGRFALHGTPFFATCDEVQYDATAAGYAPARALTSGALRVDREYAVKIGMQTR